VQDVVLDVVGVVLDEERQQLKDEALLLNGALLAHRRLVTSCGGQKWTCNAQISLLSHILSMPHNLRLRSSFVHRKIFSILQNAATLTLKIK